MNKIEVIRETSKLGLQRFFLDIENNSYDRISNEVLIIYEQKLHSLKEQQLNKNLTSEEKPDFIIEILFLEEELKSIAETKIIYAYKHFENNLKFLLNATYGVSKSKMFKWEYISEFLKTKNIDIKKVEHFSEVNELRNLNNNFKHSDNITNDTRLSSIKEFKNKESIDYLDILSFYKRIESSPLQFISSLANLIHEDLYTFDENRIENFAKKISLRMSKNEVEILIDKLRQNY